MPPALLELLKHPAHLICIPLELQAPEIPQDPVVCLAVEQGLGLNGLV